LGNLAVFFFVCGTFLFSVSYNMTETHSYNPDRPFTFPNLHE
jgi:hypothetical protein